jgi:hypothetical protein
MMIGDEVYGIVYGGNQWEGEGKGKDTKGWRGSKYITYTHMKTA